jgi:hypothetical protein
VLIRLKEPSLNHLIKELFMNQTLRNSRRTGLFPSDTIEETVMKKIGTIGAVCLAAALAATSPVLARGGGGHGGGGHGGGHGGGFHGGGFAGGHGGARFAGGGFRGGRFGGGYRRGYGGGYGYGGYGGYGPDIAGGLIVGSLLGGLGYGCYNGYYGCGYGY